MNENASTNESGKSDSGGSSGFPATPISIASETPVAKTVSRIVRISPRGSETKSAGNPLGGTNANTPALDEVQAAAIRATAKEFRPVAVKIVGVLDRAGSRIVCFYARDCTTEEERDWIKKEIQLTDEDKEIAGAALSRIVARRVSNEDAMDLIALTTIGVHYISGIALAFAEIRRLREEKADRQPELIPQNRH